MLMIAALPEGRLRALLARLATTIERAIVHELRHNHLRKKKYVAPLSAPPPDAAAVCANCRKTATPATPTQCTFHPGDIEERVFEFLSRTPEGRPFAIRRTLAMWTCCAEDYPTVGCAEAAAHLWLAA
ncbi:hypothetical protein DFH08DRAFT_84452 [Mycena albidolilacea]|uniref:Uncharacterized protein n=1 Tax=Mycena albidolilacea TaxID=1033008 RepID=A0AAD7A9V4_9AGAR|nr:hypothetical protein DFH08DRAFT_84452 [Mycena albidolilacea]